MLYVKPNYYNTFKCIADKCEATCCQGWQIVVDEASLERYKKVEGPYGDILRERIQWKEGVFCQDASKRCAFLKEDNFCDMYEHLGEESLCLTCTNYPRHIEEFENIREITLSISCPEVARIILSQQEPVSFYEEEGEEGEEEMEEFDPFFFSYLEDARKILLRILQDRNLPLSIRVALVLHMAEEMQEMIDADELFDLVDVFDKYEDPVYLAEAKRGIEKELQCFYESPTELFSYKKAMFGRLYELEHLSEEWPDYIEECFQLLYTEGANAYQTKGRAFVDSEVQIEIILEQLLVYFVFTYFCGAVYDGNVIGKIRLSVDSVTILFELFMSKWLQKKGDLTEEDMQRIVYRYSRELEHSDLNLETMEN
ncbi:MAG: flagellin lysine-N-methylase [Agathobacter sp.]|nr:flagellin lysine-N-methylase [Agathobacter sp.]